MVSPLYIMTTTPLSLSPPSSSNISKLFSSLPPEQQTSFSINELTTNQEDFKSANNDHYTDTFSNFSSILTEQIINMPSAAAASMTTWTPSSLGSLSNSITDSLTFNTNKAPSPSVGVGFNNYLTSMASVGGGMKDNISVGTSGSVYTGDQQAQQANLKEKAKRASAEVEHYLYHLYNDSSIGLYHMSEHIRRRVPQIIEDKKSLISSTKDVEISNSDMKDSLGIVESITKTSSFDNIDEMLKNTIKLIQGSKSKKVPPSTPSAKKTRLIKNHINPQTCAGQQRHCLANLDASDSFTLRKTFPIPIIYIGYLGSSLIGALLIFCGFDPLASK
ncbi:4136_t:CDS:2, partial [Entrophospora sp. SA101]